jgi:hypothetical protein
MFSSIVFSAAATGAAIIKRENGREADNPISDHSL